MKCKGCGKTPSELPEYCSPAKVEGITAEEYCAEQEGTYNKETDVFYCTSCYIKAGMSLLWKAEQQIQRDAARLISEIW